MDIAIENLKCSRPECHDCKICRAKSSCALFNKIWEWIPEELLDAGRAS